MLLLIQWLMSYLVIVFARLFGDELTNNNPMDKLGLARYKGRLYKFCRIRGNNIFLMDVVGRRGFSTIVVSLNDVEILKHPTE